MGDSQSMSTTNKVLIGVGIVAVGALAYALLAPASEEPPIRVKGGSLDIEICSNSASWDDGGNEWKVNSSSNYSNEYKFEIAVGNNCASSGPPPDKVKEVHIAVGTTSVELRRHRSFPNFSKGKTKVKPKGEFERVNPARILANQNPGDVKITVKPGYGNEPHWSCTFPAGQFQDLWLNKGRLPPAHEALAPREAFTRSAARCRPIEPAAECRAARDASGRGPPGARCQVAPWRDAWAHRVEDPLEPGGSGNGPCAPTPIATAWCRPPLWPNGALACSRASDRSTSREPTRRRCQAPRRRGPCR